MGVLKNNNLDFIVIVVFLYSFYGFFFSLSSSFLCFSAFNCHCRLFFYFFLICFSAFYCHCCLFIIIILLYYYFFYVSFRLCYCH